MVATAHAFRMQRLGERDYLLAKGCEAEGDGSVRHSRPVWISLGEPTHQLGQRGGRKATRRRPFSKILQIDHSVSPMGLNRTRASSGPTGTKVARTLVPTAGVAVSSPGLA